MTRPLHPLADDEVMRLVEHINPVPTAASTPTEAVIAEALLARIKAEAPTGEPAIARRRPWTRLAGMLDARRGAPARATGTRPATRRVRTRLAATGATAIAVFAGMVLLPTTSSAETVLLQAADAAALQPATTGAWWHEQWRITEWVYVNLHAGLEPLTYEQERWVAPDELLMRDGLSAALHAAEAGTGPIDASLVLVQDLFPGDGTEEADGVVIGPNERAARGVRFASDLSWDELLALPTDPAALREKLLDVTPASGHGRDYDLFAAAQQLVTSSPAGPELRRALWKVIADIPRATLLGTTTDTLGRPGTAVRVAFDDWYLITLILDPTTGSVLEVSTAWPDGSKEGRRTLIESGFRDSAPPAEPPLCGPGSVPEIRC